MPEFAQIAASWLFEHLYLVFGALAGAALWATAKDRDLAWIGAALVAGWATSNLLDWHASVGGQVTGYTAIEIVVFFFAGSALRRHPSIAIIGIMLAAATSVIANVAFAYTAENPPDPQHKNLWEATTNILFALECFLAIGVGVAHGVRTGRFGAGAGLDGGQVEPDCHPKARQ